VRRGEIPDALLKARKADIDRIPAAVLAKLTRADLANRLLAAGEYRRRASVPHLDGDLFRLRIGQASEVLTTSDPKRAGELVKGAGVGVTTDAGHTAPAPRTPAAAPLRKDAAPAGGGRSVYVHTPTLDSLGRSRSLDEGITKLIRQGALGHLRQDIAALEKAIPNGKAADYERKAYQVSDPALRNGYLELAVQERQKAGRA
jgi:hypothetical protein